VRPPAEASVASRPEHYAVEGKEQRGEHDSGDEQSLLHAPILHERNPGVGTACTPVQGCLHVDRPYVAAISRPHGGVVSDRLGPEALPSMQPFVAGARREVDHSRKARACDFHSCGFRRGSVDEIIDRVDLGDGRVVDLADVHLTEGGAFALARGKVKSVASPAWIWRSAGG
jgi:hypothetical protein